MQTYFRPNRKPTETDAKADFADRIPDFTDVRATRYPSLKTWDTMLKPWCSKKAWAL